MRILYPKIEIIYDIFHPPPLIRRLEIFNFRNNPKEGSFEERRKEFSSKIFWFWTMIDSPDASTSTRIEIPSEEGATRKRQVARVEENDERDRSNDGVGYPFSPSLSSFRIVATAISMNWRGERTDRFAPLVNAIASFVIGEKISLLLFSFFFSAELLVFPSIFVLSPRRLNRNWSILGKL